MATVLRVNGIRVVIFHNDHPPAHVHAQIADRRAKLSLNCPSGPVEVQDSIGFRTADLQRLVRAISAKLDEICAVWSDLYG